jgi:hypothetical protein
MILFGVSLLFGRLILCTDLGLVLIMSVCVGCLLIWEVGCSLCWTAEPCVFVGGFFSSQ